MDRKIKQAITRITALFALLLGISACEGLFNNPLKDKETGEEINLLLVDFNFFRTHITTRVFDAATGQMVTTPVTVTFSGRNGNDIVQFTGRKNPSYTLTQGQMELTADPSVAISEDSPFDLTLTARADGYLPTTKTVVFLSEGKKTIDLFMASEADRNSSDLEGGIRIGGGDTTIVFTGTFPAPVKKAPAEEKPFTISYSMSLADFLKLRDSGGAPLFASSQELLAAYNANPEGFMFIRTETSGEYPSWVDNLRINGEVNRVIFHILETGTVSFMEVNGTTVTSFNGGTLTAACSYTGSPLPERFGFMAFNADSWDYLGATLAFTALPAGYTLAEASDETFCPTGATIRFQSSLPSAFRFTADLFDLSGKLLFTQSFAGRFPASFTLENTPPVPARLVFRGDNPSFQPVPELTVASLCSGSYDVTVEPQTGYTGYQVVLRAFCPDNPQIAIAPTYNGEYRLVNEDHPWQAVSMQGGVIDLLGIPDHEYEYRILWENEWEVTRFHTSFNADGSYAYPNSSRITAEKMDDGRTRINISHLYKQSVCDAMGW